MSTPFFQVPLGYGTTFHGTQKFATQLQALNPIFATSLFNLPTTKQHSSHFNSFNCKYIHRPF